MSDSTTLKKNAINVSDLERLASIAGGAYLLLNAFSEKKSFAKAIAAGFLLYRGVSGHCPAYAALKNTRMNLKGHNINIKTAVIVNKPVSEVYAFWRNLNNLPLFMKHIKSIEVINEFISEWTVNVVGGFIKWKSEIVHDVPNERIGWKSEPGTLIENAGNVNFVEIDQFNTEVHVVISYHAPVGKIGESVAHLFNPLFEKVIKEEIHNFKDYIETGEVSTAKGQAEDNQ
jgi:uncharacterized membrane protein